MLIRYYYSYHRRTLIWIQLGSFFFAPLPCEKVLILWAFRLLAHEYLLEPSLHSCSSSRFSTTYSKTPISTDSEIVYEMGVIVCEMG